MKKVILIKKLFQESQEAKTKLEGMLETEKKHRK